MQADRQLPDRIFLNRHISEALRWPNGWANVAKGGTFSGCNYETAAALHFSGEELDPHEETRLMGAAPTSAVSKGQLIVVAGQGLRGRVGGV